MKKIKIKSWCKLKEAPDAYEFEYKEQLYETQDAIKVKSKDNKIYWIPKIAIEGSE